MPTLVRLADLRICMFAGDHNPPHFHVVGPDVAFQVRLDTLQVLRGRAKPSALARAVAWAADNRAMLDREWANLNERD